MLEDLIPIIVVLFILQVSLLVMSLRHVLTHEKYKCGNRVIWIIVSLISIIGPVIYFVFGREDE